MFIFSLVVVREFDCLQPRKRNIHTAIFDTKQNNVEAKGNVAFFSSGLIKHQYVWQEFVPNFHLNRHSYIYFYMFTVHQ